MNKKDLVLYEAPWITEWIWFDWGRSLLAKVVARRINKKWRRYQFRLKRTAFFESLKKTNTPTL